MSLPPVQSAVTPLFTAFDEACAARRVICPTMKVGTARRPCSMSEASSSYVVITGNDDRRTLGGQPVSAPAVSPLSRISRLFRRPTAPFVRLSLLAIHVRSLPARTNLNN